MRIVRKALGTWSAQDEVDETIRYAKKIADIPVNLHDIDKEIAYMDAKHTCIRRFERALQHCMDGQYGCIHTTEELYELASEISPGFENTEAVKRAIGVVDAL